MKASAGKGLFYTASFLFIAFLFLKGCEGSIEKFDEQDRTRSEQDKPVSIPLNEGKGSYEGISIRQLEGENAPVYVFENGAQLFPLSGAPCGIPNFDLDPEKKLGNRNLIYIQLPEGDFAILRELGKVDTLIPIVMNNGFNFRCPP